MERVPLPVLYHLPICLPALVSLEWPEDTAVSSHNNSPISGLSSHLCRSFLTLHVQVSNNNSIYWAPLYVVPALNKHPGMQEQQDS